MPELPEVETVRRGLELILAGASVVGVELLRPDLRRPIPLQIRQAATGPVLGVRRRAKYLLIDLPGGAVLSHLGMTGTWRHDRIPAPRDHDHVRLHLADGSALVYRDPRRFGLLDWIPLGEAAADLADLGPEPLSDGFTGAALHQAIAGRSQAIKPLIMDQRVVVGVGNIYAQEALFRARVPPLRPARRVDRAACGRLVAAIRQVLAQAIEAGGSTISDFRQAGGESGYFQTAFAVYGRPGEPCPACGTALKHGVIAGRSTCWCPRCQR